MYVFKFVGLAIISKYNYIITYIWFFLSYRLKKVENRKINNGASLFHTSVQIIVYEHAVYVIIIIISSYIIIVISEIVHI